MEPTASLVTFKSMNVMGMIVTTHEEKKYFLWQGRKKRTVIVAKEDRFYNRGRKNIKCMW